MGGAPELRSGKKKRAHRVTVRRDLPVPITGPAQWPDDRALRLGVGARVRRDVRGAALPPPACPGPAGTGTSAGGDEAAESAAVPIEAAVTVAIRLGGRSDGETRMTMTLPVTDRDAEPRPTRKVPVPTKCLPPARVLPVAPDVREARNGKCRPQGA